MGNSHPASLTQDSAQAPNGMPDPFIRWPTTVLHALPTAPEPMYQPFASYVG
jgi:hypothetical protein